MVEAIPFLSFLIQTIDKLSLINDARAHQKTEDKTDRPADPRAAAADPTAAVPTAAGQDDEDDAVPEQKDRNTG